MACGCNTRTIEKLGAVPPVIRFSTTPDNSADGRAVKWTCADWMNWHKQLVQAFKNGQFKSKIKYSDAIALSQTNIIFMSWWDKKKTLFDKKDFCGYSSDFFAYFKKAGLSDILSYLQAIVVPIVGGTANVAESAGNVLTTAGKTVENVADTAKNTTGAAKYLVPIAVAGAVALAAAYVYKHYVKEDEKVKLIK